VFSILTPLVSEAFLLLLEVVDSLLKFAMDFLKKKDLSGLSGVLSIPNQKLRPSSTLQGVLQLENKAEKYHYGEL